ncbi:MAG: carbamoyltransferase [Candidatus Brocadia sp. AMX2]|uniref:Carbamoyl transferase NodU family n=1 Tax=Candidatus Brocadia sinica JPN1 TaxID=1197129 RepID=A0ABQ0JWA4_9BACT|nr:MULTISPECIES: carbamoyltransferase [Brocadia]KXK29642.1 MAG: carbamoyltransferase [Candidatus Brocadia sinica]MBC6931739.1 carbamoyltransferase [Candidatus Brocadia sp.]MBL1167405.1 carbamoyltransferase [Candidatus Brocadia sp. AMX1]NOG41122.1 carbamoyltransferase [Planctomycetota bacterium]KAA0245804.1 MAG: carbamoyltransferase [Candidatus Brocadia sp. AMX2]
MIVLGINNMHDASAAIVVDGKVVAAAEEERFSRRKHHVGFPVNAFQYCLDEAGITIKDLDAVALSWRPWVLGTRVLNALKSVSFSKKAFQAKTSRGMGQMGNEWYQLFTMKWLIERHFGKGNFRLQYIDHHLCHAVSAFFVSPFERAAALTVDGAGEEDTTVFWMCEGTEIKRLASIKLPHSLGQFYASITGFLGFKVQSDEYKVMGMAPYGKPVFADFFRNKIFDIRKDGTFRLKSRFLDYHLARQGIFLEEIIQVLGKNRLPDEEVTNHHMDIARSAQVVIEEVLFHMANHLHSKTRVDKLCLAGGVALNCVANGKLLDNTPFRQIFVQPAAGDAGTSIGAALHVYHRYTREPRRYQMKGAYLGPSYSNQRCIETLNEFGLSYKELTKEELCSRIATFLSEGKLVCWFQGRMEWGPRALGNRSLLADPRRAEMRDIINLKVKQREPFRPFAPSVLEEKSYDYFGNPIPSPFMLFAFKVNPDRQKDIPAVTHVDGTARPQTVRKEANPLYWNLIKEFENRTGVPVLLNTSFNVQEPIVCSPKDAVACFLKTKVDYLVLNNLLIEQPHKVPS